MSHAFHVYAIGNALVDLEFTVSPSFLHTVGLQKGIMTLAEADAQASLLDKLHSSPECTPIKQASGGSAANSIIATAAFGARCFYHCKVANDSFGSLYRNDLVAAGVATNLKEDRPEGVTGTCAVMVTPDSERTMHTFLGITAEVSLAELDEEALRQSAWLYVEGYLCTSPSARDAVKHLNQKARDAGVQRAMTFSDPSMVQFFLPELTEMLGAGVDLLFCNADEALGFAKTDNLDTALAALRQVSTSGMITLGAQGVRVWTQATALDIPAPRVNAIDTLGAGDSFAGAVLYGISQGWSLERSARLALITAAQVVSQFGPRLQLEQYRSILADFEGAA